MPYPADLSWTLGLRSLIARYGELQAVARGGERRRGQQFNGLIADLLQHWGADEVDANVRGLDGRDEIDVAFRLDGIRYLLEAKWEGKPVSDEPVGKLAGRLRSRLAGAHGILLSMSGFTRHAAPAGERGDQPSVLLLDRSHFEAILSGLIPPDVLLQRLERHLTARGGVTANLQELLLHDEQPPSMAHATDTSPIADVAGGIHARKVMVGDETWPECESLDAGHADNSLLLSTPSGIIELTVGNESSRWALPMLGCHGATLVDPDGSIRTLSNFAAVRWNGEKIEILGGALTGNATLLAGPDGTTWAFQNTGADYNNQVTLTELGSGLGMQNTHVIDFSAGIWNAAWLEGQWFYLAADGSSAIVDLAQSSYVSRDAWQTSPQDGPRSIVVRDASTILTFARAPGVKASLVQINTKTGTNGRLLQIFANHALGMTCTPTGLLYLLVDQRGNARLPLPTLLEVSVAS